MEKQHLPPVGRRIQVVFFDATGTLLEIKGSVGEIYSSVARRYGVEPDPERIQAAFSAAFRAQPPLAFPVNAPDLHRLEYAWWRQLVAEVFAEYRFPRFEEFFAEVFAYFGSQDAWRVYPDAEPALEAVRARGLRAAVISNFDTRLGGLLRSLGLDGYFDEINISTQVGAAKPDPLIFRTALERQRVHPQNAIHVGDSRSEDVAGAAAAGIDAILLERGQRSVQEERGQRSVQEERGQRSIPEDHVKRITGLSQLIEMLG